MRITEIKAMSRDEQLIAMELLWDELCHHGPEPESPDWHRDILEKRQAGIAEGNVEYLTIDDLKNRFRA